MPPSEAKAVGGRPAPGGAPRRSFPELEPVRQRVADALVAAMAGSSAARSKLLGVEGDALSTATATNRALADTGVRPAIERYTGVLYDALDYGGCPSALRRRLDRQVVIFSGLWGALGPRDLIGEYKLKMGASLKPLGRVSAIWRDPLTDALAPVSDRRVVWDLLPNEHAAAWRPDRLTIRRRITVRFLDDVAHGSGRRLVTVSHWNKLLKGALVRHLIEHQITDPVDLHDFHHPQGYRFRPDLSQLDGEVAEAVFVARR